MKKLLKHLLIVGLIGLSQVATAQISSSLVDQLKNDEDFNYSNYYLIIENQNSDLINLLNLKNIQSKFPMPNVPYKRDLHFGGWLRDTANGSCLNTRGKVLVRDSVSSVTYTPNGCTVDKGEWNDPYTANSYNSSQAIQIDHIVALKNTYMTGAHEWDFKKRCLYANYIGNNFHLLSVDGKENLKKSDHTPSGYVPPNKAFTCEFVKTWLKVKLIWSLRITPKESDAIQKIVQSNNCDSHDFVLTVDELNAQRDYMSANANLCSSNEVSIEKF